MNPLSNTPTPDEHRDAVLDEWRRDREHEIHGVIEDLLALCYVFADEAHERIHYMSGSPSVSDCDPELLYYTRQLQEHFSHPYDIRRRERERAELRELRERCERLEADKLSLYERWKRKDEDLKAARNLNERMKVENERLLERLSQSMFYEARLRSALLSGNIYSWGFGDDDEDGPEEDS